MAQHADHHVTAELEILKRLIKGGVGSLDHEGVEKDEIDGEEDLNCSYERVQVDASFPISEGLEESSLRVLSNILRVVLNNL